MKLETLWKDMSIRGLRSVHLYLPPRRLVASAAVAKVKVVKGYVGITVNGA